MAILDSLAGCFGYRKSFENIETTPKMILFIIFWDACMFCVDWTVIPEVIVLFSVWSLRRLCLRCRPMVVCSAAPPSHGKHEDGHRSRPCVPRQLSGATQCGQARRSHSIHGQGMVSHQSGVIMVHLLEV